MSEMRFSGVLKYMGAPTWVQGVQASRGAGPPGREGLLQPQGVPGFRILVDKSKSHGQFWSETTRKASGQIVSGQ